MKLSQKKLILGDNHKKIWMAKKIDITFLRKEGDNYPKKIILIKYNSTSNQLITAYTLNLKCMISPSPTTYSLPSTDILPASLHPSSVLYIS